MKCQSVISLPENISGQRAGMIWVQHPRVEEVGNTDFPFACHVFCVPSCKLAWTQKSRDLRFGDRRFWVSMMFHDNFYVKSSGYLLNLRDRLRQAAIIGDCLHGVGVGHILSIQSHRVTLKWICFAKGTTTASAGHCSEGAVADRKKTNNYACQLSPRALWAAPCLAFGFLA